jgi:hypothetical protein
MTPEEIRALTAARLAGWTEKLVGDHATPVLLIGFGHDAHSGEIVLIVVDEDAFDNHVIAACLRYALKHLPQATRA